MRPVILTPDQWKTIRRQLQEEYPKTVFMLRNKMKSILGFTVREHKRWIDKEEVWGDVHSAGFTKFEIHLDFYSENKRTMFLLKFSEIISEKR